MGSYTMDEPEAVHWSYNDVIDWIKDLGYPQYAECFRTNFIDGKKLILMNGSTLPNIGIQDYEHIKAISRDIKQNILKIQDDKWDRSISLESREPLALYFEQKSHTGRYTNALTLEKFYNERAAAVRKRMFQ